MPIDGKLPAAKASQPAHRIALNRLRDGNTNTMSQDAEIADHRGMFVDGPADDNGGVLTGQKFENRSLKTSTRAHLGCTQASSRIGGCGRTCLCSCRPTGQTRICLRLLTGTRPVLPLV